MLSTVTNNQSSFGLVQFWSSLKNSLRNIFFQIALKKRYITYMQVEIVPERNKMQYIKIVKSHNNFTSSFFSNSLLQFRYHECPSLASNLIQKFIKFMLV